MVAPSGASPTGWPTWASVCTAASRDMPVRRFSPATTSTVFASPERIAMSATISIAAPVPPPSWTA